MTRFACLILLLLTGFRAASREQFMRHYWLTESNAPVKVNALVQGGDGFIWLGTEDGLYRFNGTGFLHLSDSIHQPVTALAAFGSELLVGFRNGRVARVSSQGRVIPIAVRGKAPSTGITAILTAGLGSLILATEGEGLFIIVNGIGTTLDAGSGLSDNYVYAIQWLQQGEAGAPTSFPSGLLAATDKGINLLRMVQGRLIVTQISSAAPGGLSDNIVRSLGGVGQSRFFWAGLQEHGFNRLEIGREQGWSLWKNGGPWTFGQINDILPRNREAAWIATEKGLVYWHEQAPELLLADKKVNKVLLDHAGNIWCATNEGLTRLSSNYASFTRVPLVLRSVTALAAGKDQTVWYTQNKELWRMSTDSAGSYGKFWSAPEIITALHADAGGGLWIGTMGHGLFYRNPEGRVSAVQGQSDDFQHSHVLSIARIGDKVWISTLNGLLELTVQEHAEPMVTRVRKHKKQDGVGSDYVYQLFPDSRGRMWLATDGAGVRMYDGAYHSWDSSSGLTCKVVYTLTEDAAGHIWAGTLENGLFEFDGSKWRRYSRRQGLQDINVATLLANKSGQVIIVHALGVDEWYPQGRQFRHYGRRLGVDLDSVSAALNCGARDAAGNVYIPFEHGIITFSNISLPGAILPSIKLSEVALFLKPVEEGKRGFDHDENYLTFRYNGVNFINPDRLHYRYMLQGYNEDWVYTNDEEITFPRLPPGHYRFRIQASLSHSFGAAAEDHFEFWIRNPFWMEWWFIVISACLLGILIYFLLKVRDRGLKKVSLLQKERMVAEYEQLKSQVNPHFLFNSLNTLVSLIEDDQEKAVEYTVHLSDLYRNMLSFRNLDVISLKEEWDILQKYLFIQQSRFGSALQIQSGIPPQLMDTKQVVPLALQMLVENAIKHNIVSRSQPLVILVEANEEWLTVRHILRPKHSAEKGAGISMINISSRYSLLTRKEVIYGVRGNEYIVSLPLL